MKPQSPQFVKVKLYLRHSILLTTNTKADEK